MHDDEERTLATLTAHRAIIDELIANGRGEIAGTAGDSVLAEFASVVDAVRTAVAIQQALAKANEPLPEDSRMLFRIGINVGDVMVKDGDIFGDGVNVAARLEGIAEPGGICVTRGVRDHLRDRMEYKFEDLGEHSVKNISRPVRVFRVSFDPDRNDGIGGQRAAAAERRGRVGEAVAAIATKPSRSSWRSGNPSRRATIPRSTRPISSNFRKARSQRLPKSRLAGPAGTSPSADHTVELEFWNSIKDTDVRANFEAYLKKYPEGEFKSLAEIRLRPPSETADAEKS